MPSDWCCRAGVACSFAPRRGWSRDGWRTMSFPRSRMHGDHHRSKCSHPFRKIYLYPPGSQNAMWWGWVRLGEIVCVSVPESHLAQVGGRVRWGQAGSDFQLQNGLMQFVLLILSLMLTTTHAEALTKLSQSAKVAFKHQHPCPATGSPRGPCKGYVIDHIVPIAKGLMHRATCSGKQLPTPKRRTSGSASGAGIESAEMAPCMTVRTPSATTQGKRIDSS